MKIKNLTRHILWGFLWYIIVIMSQTSCAIGEGDALDNLFVNDPLFITGGTGSNYFTSTDGITWKNAGNLGLNSITMSTYQEGRFIMGGNSGSNVFLAATSDSANWDITTTPILGYPNDIHHHEGMSLVVMRTGDTGIHLCRDNSHSQVLATGNPMLCLAASDDFLVAGGGGGSVYTSVTGTTWTQVVGINSSYTFWDAVYAQGRFVLVGDITSTSLIISTSSGTDGYSANLRPFVGGIIYCIAYGNRRFVAPDTAGQVFYSDDGNTWSYITTPFSNITDITYANRRFVAVTSVGGIYYSEDGVSWNFAFNTGTTLFTIASRP